MTTDKAQKKAVRARMQKTGERYTAARCMLLDLHRPDQPDTTTAAANATATAIANGADAAAVALDPPVAATAPEANPAAVVEPESIAPAEPNLGMSDESLRRATGRGWREWLALLDAWGAADHAHPAIARHLSDEHGVDGWWAQTVTVGYERARGRRAIHQHADGFTAGVSRTFPVAAERLTEFFAVEGTRDRWLDPGTLSLRRSTPGRSARFDVAGGGRLAIFVTAKGPAKCSVALQHEKLPDAEAVARWRAFWKERLTRLGDEIPEE